MKIVLLFALSLQVVFSCFQLQHWSFVWEFCILTLLRDTFLEFYGLMLSLENLLKYMSAMPKKIKFC